MAATKKLDLLQGPIVSTLTKLALPLMGMSLLQTLYNLTDMFWIGQLGAGPVAAVGTGGLLVWLSQGIHMLAQVGGQVYVAQRLGAGEKEKAGNYAYAALLMSCAIGLLLGLVYFFFRTPIVQFFNLGDPTVIAQAEEYLSIVGGLIVFMLNTKLMTALITATGNSKIPFLLSGVGLLLNMVLDPVLILGLAGFPRLEVVGAALATVFAQLVVFILLALYMRRDPVLFSRIKLSKPPKHTYYREILKLSYAPALQGSLYPLISIVISRMVADFGYTAVAVQRVGSQLEALSWMMSDGFAIAVNSLIAQNYGARNIKRAKQSFFAGAKIIVVMGLLVSALFIFFGQPLSSLFFTAADSAAIAMTTSYLWIMGLSQVFMCGEILCNNAMNAFGKTVWPAACIIVLTALRIPLGMVLSETALAVDGIWWAISITTIGKGICLAVLITILFRQLTRQSTLGR